MPLVTYMTDDNIAALRTVPDDKELNDLLKEARMISGDDWLIEVRHREEWSIWDSLLRREPKKGQKVYTLYCSFGYEVQVMNLFGSGSVFSTIKPLPLKGENTRDCVGNFLLGVISAHYYMKLTPLNQPTGGDEPQGPVTNQPLNQE